MLRGISAGFTGLRVYGCRTFGAEGFPVFRVGIWAWGVQGSSGRFDPTTIGPRPKLWQLRFPSIGGHAPPCQQR